MPAKPPCDDRCNVSTHWQRVYSLVSIRWEDRTRMSDAITRAVDLLTHSPHMRACVVATNIDDDHYHVLVEHWRHEP